MSGSLLVDPLDAADVNVLAALHRKAFPGFFLSSLGEPFLREFYRGFLLDPTAITVVLRDFDGAVLGCAVGTTEPSGFFTRLLRRRWLGFARASVGAILRQPTVSLRLVRAMAYRGGEASGCDALLSSICVAPEMRGGSGSLVLFAWEQQAATLGARSAYLTTDAEQNELVNRFYRGRGWSLEATFVTPEGRRMNRYTKELELV